MDPENVERGGLDSLRTRRGGERLYREGASKRKQDQLKSDRDFVTRAGDKEGNLRRAGW